MNHLGSQNHNKCGLHHLPLITSTRRGGRCQCGKKEYLRCSDLRCNALICKRCFEGCSEDDITQIMPSKHTPENNNEGENIIEEEEDDSDGNISIPTS